MAIFESNYLGKISGTVGNVNMYESGGQNVLRGKRLGEKRERTPAQQANMACMKAVREMAAQLDGIIAIGYPAISLSKSENAFVSCNFGLMQADEECRVHYDATKLCLSSGELAAPDVTASTDASTGTVTFVQRRQPLKPLMYDDDQVYGLICDMSKMRYLIVELKLRGVSDETTVLLPNELRGCHLQLYAFARNARATKASATLWMMETNVGK